MIEKINFLRIIRTSFIVFAFCNKSVLRNLPSTSTLAKSVPRTPEHASCTLAYRSRTSWMPPCLRENRGLGLIKAAVSTAI